MTFQFQSTHSITECDDVQGLAENLNKHFNPRTPLQSATRPNTKGERKWNISIHALHYRVRRPNPSLLAWDRTEFQSTHSITECDYAPDAFKRDYQHFNPRTPLQSATTGVSPLMALVPISIHALHYRVRPEFIPATAPEAPSFQSTHSITECDSFCQLLFSLCWQFQSTHSITECDTLNMH